MTKAVDPFIPPIRTLPTEPVKLKLPGNEKRAHKYFVLDNGLQAIVISDPTSERAAASLLVTAGSAHDAKNFNGCAHFCEHLLFQGSAKASIFRFPGNGEYKRYLKENDGRCNAGTSQAHTSYFFEVAAGAFHGAFDRFAGFFVDPLFSKDCVDREVNAIQSEYLGKQTDMGRLTFTAIKALGGPDHPFSNNSCGTIDTLLHKPTAEGRDPRAELIAWYEKHYSADRMYIAVTGTESVEELERGVRLRLDGVPRRNTDITLTQEPWFSEETFKSVAYYKPIAQEQRLIMVFQLPRHDHLYQVRPLRIICHILRHKGPGSLYAYLKAKGWSTGIGVSISSDSAVYPYLEMEVKLTDDGVTRWKNVVSIIFSALDVYRSSNLEPVFHQLREMGDIRFAYTDQEQPGDYVRSVVQRMAKNVPREEILSSSVTYGDTFDDAQVTSAFQRLEPSKASILLFSPDKPADIDAEMDRTEVIYGRSYARQRLDESLYTDIPTIRELQVPPPNPYIPKDLKVKEQDTSPSYPTVVRETALSRLWHKADKFEQPKAVVRIALESPLLATSPRNEALKVMLLETFRDATEDDRQYAAQAELSSAVSGSVALPCLSVYVGGFSDKLVSYLATVLFKLKTFTPDVLRFPQILDKARRDKESAEFKKPAQLLMSRIRLVRQSVNWTAEEVIEELKFVTVDDVLRFRNELLLRLFIQTLVHGNLSRDEALGLQTTLENTLGSRPLSRGELVNPRWLNLSEGDKLWETPVPNPEAPTNGVTIDMQGPSTDATYAERAAFVVACRILTQPFFHSLRTTQQLGYAVQAVPSESEACHKLIMLVESPRDPVYVESRMIDFVDTFTFSEADTERHRQAFINALLVKPRSLGDETTEYWSMIARHVYDFSANESFIEAARGLTHADVVAAFDRHIATASPARRCVTIHMRAAKCTPSAKEREKQVASKRWINDIVEFKGSLTPARAFGAFSLAARQRGSGVGQHDSKP